MLTFKLRGLAEGLVGMPSVLAKSKVQLFSKYPVLQGVHTKLAFSGNTVLGFAPCDG